MVVGISIPVVANVLSCRKVEIPDEKRGPQIIYSNEVSISLDGCCLYGVAWTKNENSIGDKLRMSVGVNEKKQFKVKFTKVEENA